jgi:hypothetical protein
MAEAQDPYYAMDICKSGTRSGWSCGWVGLPEPYVLWYDDDNPCPLNAAWTHRVRDQSHFTTVSHVLRSYPGTTTNF